uniref:Uncharacterized protein n=1 Tax=Ananas comosus var. bracteatus TaxID=296719 RepID=A0A6V7PT14_ANACO|nr:unnamed protein product [Ananas comosus var. bracteatus]
MQRVGSGSTTSGSTRPRKEKRLSYVLNDADDTKVNDAVLTGSTLVSCSSDTTLKTWNSLSDGACTSTLRQHSDYVNCLATAVKNSNIIASGGLGGEVFIWDIDAAVIPVAKSVEPMEDDYSNENYRQPLASSHCSSTSSNVSVYNTEPHYCYSPVAVKGHKESVYALAMNESGTVLVSGGTEKVIRVWDPRTGSKNMKLQGHTDNIRTLLLDSTGRYCLSGSSDSMIRLWDLGQQRCIHSYAVHTDSVWALASTPNFTHVYSGGRDLSLCLTDLSTRESLVLCTKEHSILQLVLQDETIWVATTDSSVQGWPADGHNFQKDFGKGGSFVAGNLSSTRASASLEGTASAPVHKESSFTIPGSPVIIQHEILNNRRRVLTKDSAGSVKLWEITSGAVIEDYGKVSFDKKKEELFEMINLAQETLRGLLACWLTNKRLRCELQASTKDDGSIGKDVTNRNVFHSRVEFDDRDNIDDTTVLPPFDFSTVSPPSIVTEGSCGVPWRKKITDLVGTEDEKDLPWWCIDCVLNGRLPPRDHIK